MTVAHRYLGRQVGGHEAVVKLLADRNDVEADLKDNSSRTPLVKLLIDRDDVETDSH